VLSLRPEQDLDRIAAGLAGAGAFALVQVEAEALERIERRYGGEAYRRVMDGLSALVRELVAEAAPGVEIVVAEERSRGAISAFVFCPRSHRQFYTVTLRNLAASVGHGLALQGRRAVYPYLKGPLDLAVGVALVLHNPTIKPERQILQAVEDARRDARLELELRARQHRRDVADVILSSGIHNAKVLGYEALSRGPQGTDFASPAFLFGRAEETGLLYELDSLCRRVALEGAHRLPPGSQLFLNCLPTAIGDPSLRDDGLRKLLESFDWKPTDLVLEISESESIENFAAFREVADSCREVGVQIAIDDAGTGYASLEAIMEIAPDYIKTDLVLARGIDQDPSRQEVMRAMNAVARGIGASVIAEGIESEPELRTLRELGVHYGQGFYFGAALRGETR
jgi:EAL domain-containing protein (putative c-di-GMP-specific phosphodiesterase class I)